MSSSDLKKTSSRVSSIHKGSQKDVDDASGNAELGPDAQVPLPTFEHERSLVLKFDLRILPVLAFMYLANALDKGNLGNAKTNGMEADLHFKDGQYNTILSVFFVPYVIFAAPVAFVGKKFGPARVLPILMFIFGSMTLLSAAVKNFSGMMATRWILGEGLTSCSSLERNLTRER